MRKKYPCLSAISGLEFLKGMRLQPRWVIVEPFKAWKLTGKIEEYQCEMESIQVSASQNVNFAEAWITACWTDSVFGKDCSVN